MATIYIHTIVLDFDPKWKLKSQGLSWTEVNSASGQINVALVLVLSRPVVPGCAGRVCHGTPRFGRLVNPISTRGDRLCPPNYYWHTRIFRPSDGPVFGFSRSNGLSIKTKFNFSHFHTNFVFILPMKIKQKRLQPIVCGCSCYRLGFVCKLSSSLITRYEVTFSSAWWDFGIKFRTT